MVLIRSIIDFLRDKNYRDLLITTFLVIIIGGIVFKTLEGWRWIDAFYFCIITLTTVGYGDIAPKTDAGKIFNMFYILLGLGLILAFVKTVYDHYEFTKNKVGNKKQNKQ